MVPRINMKMIRVENPLGNYPNTLGTDLNTIPAQLPDRTKATRTSYLILPGRQSYPESTVGEAWSAFETIQ